MAGYGSLGGSVLEAITRDHRGEVATAPASQPAPSSSSVIPAVALLAGAGLVAFLIYKKMKKA